MVRGVTIAFSTRVDAIRSIFASGIAFAHANPDYYRPSGQTRRVSARNSVQGWRLEADDGVSPLEWHLCRSRWSAGQRSVRCVLSRLRRLGNAADRLAAVQRHTGPTTGGQRTQANRLARTQGRRDALAVSDGSSLGGGLSASRCGSPACRRADTGTSSQQTRRQPDVPRMTGTRAHRSPWTRPGPSWADTGVQNSTDGPRQSVGRSLARAIAEPTSRQPSQPLGPGRCRHQFNSALQHA